MAHQYNSWGRTRRPKNILGTDRTVVLGGASSNVVDNSAPVDDLRETISAVSLNKSTRLLTITTANSLGTDVFDGAGGVVLADGLHPLLEGIPLKIASTVDGSNQTIVSIPEHINQTQLNNMTLSVSGTLVQQTTHGVRTENARFLHLYIDDGGDDSATVEVWGYNYAFGRWAPLTMATDLDGAANAAFNNILITATAAPKMVVVPINGIDKVYFKTSADDNTVVISAAISTF